MAPRILDALTNPVIEGSSIQGHHVGRVHSIPPEVISFIFSLCSPQNHNPYLHYRQVIRLALVCFRWYSIAYTSPHLWSHLNVLFPLSIVRLLLTRSGGTPLSIAPPTPPPDSNYPDYLFTIVFQNGKSFVKMVSEHVVRWRHVHLNILDTEDLQPLVTATAPHLETLRLNHVMGLQTVNIDLLQGGTPRLEYLSLSGITLRWQSSLFLGLRSLEATQLRHGPSAAELQGLLNACPELELLGLGFVHSAWDEAEAADEGDAAVIYAPRLQRLSVSKMPFHVAYPVFAHLNAPNLLEFDIGIWDRREHDILTVYNGHFVGFWTNWLHRYFNLDELHLSLSVKQLALLNPDAGGLRSTRRILMEVEACPRYSTERLADAFEQAVDVTWAIQTLQLDMSSDDEIRINALMNPCRRLRKVKKLVMGFGFRFGHIWPGVRDRLSGEAGWILFPGLEVLQVERSALIQDGGDVLEIVGGRQGRGEALQSIHIGLPPDPSIRRQIEELMDDGAATFGMEHFEFVF